MPNFRVVQVGDKFVVEDELGRRERGRFHREQQALDWITQKNANALSHKAHLQADKMEPDFYGANEKVIRGE